MIGIDIIQIRYAIFGVIVYIIPCHSTITRQNLQIDCIYIIGCSVYCIHPSGSRTIVKFFQSVDLRHVVSVSYTKRNIIVQEHHFCHIFCGTSLRNATFNLIQPESSPCMCIFSMFFVTYERKVHLYHFLIFSVFSFDDHRIRFCHFSISGSNFNNNFCITII